MDSQNPKIDALTPNNDNNNLEPENEEEEDQLEFTKLGDNEASQLLKMSHSTLVQKLLEAEQEIKRLKASLSENDDNGNSSQCQVLELLTESITNNNDFPCLSAGPSSPICPTPPYEHITISPKMLFYINPKFYIQEPLSEEGQSGLILCFDPSEIDLELRQILIEKPPIQHQIVRKKSRLERGSSVPNIDSYYGTEDLAKVGHASYFIPTLSPQEREAIGWKSKYCYGKWKYPPTQSANVFPNSITSIRSYRKKGGKIINSYPPNPHEVEEFDESKNSNLFLKWLHCLLPNCFNSHKKFPIGATNSTSPSSGSSPRPSFWNRIWKSASAVIAGGDLETSSQNSSSSLPSPPPPIMIPVFTGETTTRIMWFFGANPPEDHRILLNNLRTNSN